MPPLVPDPAWNIESYATLLMSILELETVLFGTWPLYIKQTHLIIRSGMVTAGLILMAYATL